MGIEVKYINHKDNKCITARFVSWEQYRRWYDTAVQLNVGMKLVSMQGKIQ